MGRVADSTPLGQPQEQTPHWETATFGGGCFWCLDAVFRQLKGVKTVVSGYAGGHWPHPTYERICSGTTGHAEVVQLVFDADQISYEELLDVFFQIHDPTQLNRQGADVGTQYRSVVFTHSAAQMQEVRRWMTFHAGEYASPLVTQVETLEHFYPAEDYHQDFFSKNPRQGYCQAVVAPKVKRAQQLFASLLK